MPSPSWPHLVLITPKGSPPNPIDIQIWGLTFQIVIFWWTHVNTTIQFLFLQSIHMLSLTHLLICMCNLPATSYRALEGRDSLLTPVSLVPGTGPDNWWSEGGRTERIRGHSWPWRICSLLRFPVRKPRDSLGLVVTQCTSSYLGSWVSWDWEEREAGSWIGGSEA
jgi:hypothetical protein